MDQIVVAALVMATALLLAVVNKGIVDFLAAPVRKRFPELDLWFLVYVSLVTGAAIAWFGEVNLFDGIVPNAILGRVLTCILVGCGASLIHDIFDKKPSADDRAWVGNVLAAKQFLSDMWDDDLEDIRNYGIGDGDDDEYGPGPAFPFEGGATADMGDEDIRDLQRNLRAQREARDAEPAQ